MEKLDRKLTEILEAGGASVRLRNIIKAICSTEVPSFVTVGEYLADRDANEEKVKRWRGAGEKTVNELNSLLNLFSSGQLKIDDQITQANTRVDKKRLKLEEEIASLKELSNQIASVYPMVFDRFQEIVEAVDVDEAPDETKIWKLIKDGRGILKLGNKVSMFKMRLEGATLEEAAKAANVTRQRVQQLESRLKPYLTDITSPGWLLSKLRLIETYNRGVMPRDEELDACHPCLKSALKVHYLGAEGSIRASKRALKPVERKQLSSLLGVKLDDETNSDLLKRWTLERVIKEIRELAAELGTPDLMPKQQEQAAAGKTALRGVITRYGGQSKVAELAGLKYQGQLVNDDGSRIYWTDERIVAALHEIALLNGHPGVMPSQNECRAAYPESQGIIASLTQSNAASSERTRSWLELAELARLKLDKGVHRKTIGYIKSFVKSLGDALDVLTPAEIYVLFEQQNITKTGDNRNRSRSFDNLVEAIQSGYLPSSEVKGWADGNDSTLVENLLDPENKTVEEAFNVAGVKLPKAKRLRRSDADLDEIEDIEQQLPVPSSLETLKALDKATSLLQRTSSDEEAVDFLIAKAASKLWARCFSDETQAVKEAQQHEGNLYSNTAKDKFLREYEASSKLVLPVGYQFKNVDGQIVQPKLMQRLIATKLVTEGRVLNLSGTGTGKTLSAVLASRVAGARLTVISCPNSTISGWVSTIKNAFPDSEIATKTFSPNWETHKPRYLVVNHEIFQDRNEPTLKKFINENVVDLIVIDELHQVKQRDKKSESQRRRLLTGLITDIPQDRPRPRVLGLSATPVINNLFEGKSLVELVSGYKHDEIGSDVTVENCMRLYQKFTTMGFRMLPKASIERLPRVTEIDASNSIPHLVALGKGAHPQQIEALLVRERWPTIKAALRKKTVIFTDYVKDIVPFLITQVRSAGFSAGAFTGDDKEATDLGFTDMLDQFKRGDLDVLVASIKTAGTGVDGLQFVCNNVIFATLPWTCTDYEQAVGRFDREGVKFESLEIHIPLTYAYLKNGERWSWCESKLARIENKRDIAKASVDGEIPDSQAQLSPTEATKYWMKWLERLNEYGLSTIDRYEIKVPLSDDSGEETQRRLASYGDFASLNVRWNKANSAKTHARLVENPEEWCFYHTLMREHEAAWEVVPRVECVDHLLRNIPAGAVVGDFGAGEAGLAKALSSVHTVHSFDHVAINDLVEQCDMSHTSLEPESLDAAIFSLSLMGSNFKDYVMEAYRTLKPGAQLIIWHPLNSINIEKFSDGLGKLGFVVAQKGPRWKWAYIWAIKEGRQRDPSYPLELT